MFKVIGSSAPSFRNQDQHFRKHLDHAEFPKLSTRDDSLKLLFIVSLECLAGRREALPFVLSESSQTIADFSGDLSSKGQGWPTKEANTRWNEMSRLFKSDPQIKTADQLINAYHKRYQTTPFKDHSKRRMNDEEQHPGRSLKNPRTDAGSTQSNGQPPIDGSAAAGPLDALFSSLQEGYVEQVTARLDQDEDQLASRPSHPPDIDDHSMGFAALEATAYGKQLLCERQPSAPNELPSITPRDGAELVKAFGLPPGT